MAEKQKQAFLSRLFELRSVIGLLFAIYGVVCLVWGLAFTTQRELDKAAGVNVNLWTGAGMLLFGAAFLAWATFGAKPEDASGARGEAAEGD